MRPVWRLALSSLAGRRVRTALLVGAVAASAALIVAITCGVASVNATLRSRVAATVGVADLRVTRINESAFDASIAETIASWPGVRAVIPAARGPVTLAGLSGGEEVVAIGAGADLSTVFDTRPLDLVAGRQPSAPDEIAVEERLADDLGVGPGGRVRVVSFFGGPDTLTVTGVIRKAPFADLSRPPAVLDRATLGAILGEPDRVRAIDVILEPGADAFAFADAHQADLPEGLLLQPTERITSGIDQNIRAQTVGLTVVAIIGFLAAAFIILTGQATDVVQRQRELAVVRSVGGSRGQVAGAQLLAGAIIGALGALVGVPAGAAIALVGVTFFREHLQAGLVIPPMGVGAAAAGAIGSGVLGAAWPAILASRVSPLQALAARARPRRTRSVLIVGAVGAGLALAEFVLLAMSNAGDRSFWIYILGGVQGLFVGYFLLGALAVVITARLIGPALARLVRVPPALIAETVAVAPFRYGMTAASLMVGLAMMIVIWTAGGAVVKQWLGAVEFPDAFVYGWMGITPEDRARVDALPFVRRTNAVAIVDADDRGVFGVSGLHNVGTTFVAFEPEPFFATTRVTWIEGDEETARRRLDAGCAVLVAQEFKVARGLGVGDRLTLGIAGRDAEFEIVGVIASPGLEIASRYFDIGRMYRNQAVSAVFGTRADLERLAGVDDVQLIQIDLDDAVDDTDAVRRLRRAFAGTSVSVGSGREIKGTIETIATGSFLVMSSVAVAAILIACLGVGNVILAGIEARAFEFGVLRAVGASGPLLTRLVLIEALIMGLAGCLLGTGLGLQGAWSEMRLYRQLAGLDLALRPPIGPIAAGWGIVMLLALAAAVAPAARLGRRRPRELLAEPE